MTWLKRGWKPALALLILALVARHFIRLLSQPELDPYPFALRIPHLILAGILYLGAHTLWAWFWVRLLRSQGAQVRFVDGFRAYCVSQQMPLLVAETDYNIAYLYYLRGEYTRAIELYRATRDHCHALGDAYHQGLCDLDQSEMYLELNLSEEGSHLARRAHETFDQLGMGYEAAKAMTFLAIAVSHHGDAEMALEAFRAAFTV